MIAAELSQVDGMAPAVRRSRLADTRLWRSAELSDEERDALDAVAEFRFLDRGRAILRDGERSQALHLLLEGWAYRSMITPEGGRQICAILVPGDICDVDALRVDHIDCGITTLTACRLAALPLASVRHLARSHSGIAAAFGWLGSLENLIFSQRLLSLGRRSADRRMAHLLCELVVRISPTGTIEDNAIIPLPLTQEQLGDTLGLTPVHINRTLRLLRGKGLVVAERGSLTVLDWGALQRHGGFRPEYLNQGRSRTGLES